MSFARFAMWSFGRYWGGIGGGLRAAGGEITADLGLCGQISPEHGVKTGSLMLLKYVFLRRFVLGKSMTELM